MDDKINNTQSAPGTANPQSAVPADGASNGADFQSTAPSEALRNQVDNLSVQETGEPATGSQAPATATDFPLGWVVAIGITVVIGIVVLVRLLKEAAEESAPAPVRKSAPVTAKSTKAAKAPAKKTTAKKTSAKKKSAPAQRKKKPAARKKR